MEYATIKETRAHAPGLSQRMGKLQISELDKADKWISLRQDRNVPSLGLGYAPEALTRENMVIKVSR